MTIHTLVSVYWMHRIPYGVSWRSLELILKPRKIIVNVVMRHPHPLQPRRQQTIMLNRLMTRILTEQVSLTSQEPMNTYRPRRRICLPMSLYRSHRSRCLYRLNRPPVPNLRLRSLLSSLPDLMTLLSIVQRACSRSYWSNPHLHSNIYFPASPHPSRATYSTIDRAGPGLSHLHWHFSSPTRCCGTLTGRVLQLPAQLPRARKPCCHSEYLPWTRYHRELWNGP
ncbi:uncharacterized protein B0H18DRAFT_668462 [Fomitopsis serialis]|uniref:uncharacterized protein n=1 Tax=Fomitopsis serialis TaxID=139415 RepID=UPI002007B89C|nr:uncharacterized protein B0H18DRAFT_668462 [Neoantrodia serialis]KAH9918452.1 hypothetical protein B0H18DRAFT_668462 [Neoantrodia serialis]